MLIIGCSHGKHLGSLVAKKLKKAYSALVVDKFPDDELMVRFNCELKDREVVLVQSFYNNISDCIIEVIFAAKTAQELGAKSVALVAPYFPYLRQDKRFNKGEAISQGIVAGLIDEYFDAVYVIDPHLHRKDKLEHIFKTKTKKLTANALIAGYIGQHIGLGNLVVIGPDEESYKWARNVAEIIGAESMILRKKRHSSYNVEVRLNKKTNLNGKKAVIVDDIVSTGHTILETARLLSKLHAEKVYCICVHGIFAGDSLNKLKKARINIISTNTIPSKVAKIDVSGVIAEKLHNKLI